MIKVAKPWDNVPFGNGASENSKSLWELFARHVCINQLQHDDITYL